MQNDNRMYESLVLFRNVKKAQRTPARKILLRICAAMLIIALLAGGTYTVNIILKYRTARTFLRELYTVTEEDRIDPQQRVERLRTLARDDVVESLLTNDGIPAVYFHRNHLALTSSFCQDPRKMNFSPTKQPGVFAVSGEVAIHHAPTNATRFNAPSPAFYLTIDNGTVTSFYAPLIRWQDHARAEWE